MTLKIAIYGYDSDVGKLVLETMEEEHFEVKDLIPLSPLSGEFDAVTLNGKNYMIRSVNEFDFKNADVALFLTTADESERLVPEARESGCIVIDVSGFFSADQSVSTVLPELNPYEVPRGMETGLLIPASSSATLTALTLSPLADEFGIERASACIMQSVSEQGRVGTETLAHETVRLLNGLEGEHYGFDAQVAFNLFSHTGKVDDDGYSAGERIIAEQTQRVLGRMNGGLDVTCLQVPVFYGHTAVIHVDLSASTTVDEVKEILKSAPWIEFRNNELITTVENAVNERKILVTRVKAHGRSGKSYSFIAMMDNSRRGEAVNVIELLKLVSKERSS